MYECSFVKCSFVSDESPLVLVQDLFQLSVSLETRILEDFVTLEFILDRYFHA